MRYFGDSHGAFDLRAIAGRTRPFHDHFAVKDCNQPGIRISSSYRNQL